MLQITIVLTTGRDIVALGSKLQYQYLSLKKICQIRYAEQDAFKIYNAKASYLIK